MTIDDLGRITWQATTATTTGTYHVKVHAINSGGLASAPQEFDLDVVAIQCRISDRCRKDSLPVAGSMAVPAFATKAIAGSVASGTWMFAEWLLVLPVPRFWD